jgi:osmotically-inducible protein OsmY
MEVLMSAKMQTKTDSEIQQAVWRELKWDNRVAETEVGVTVERGVVTLTGTVDSYAKKLAAQESAHRVRGVPT